MSHEVNRRQFIATTSAGVGLTLAQRAAAAARPAALGGEPIRVAPFASWPQIDESNEAAVLEALRAGRWYRDRTVDAFEAAFAELNRSQFCVATASGTTALYTSLGALGVGPGDEVIVPPYTFMATVSVVLLHYALPVFVDSDRETFLMDPQKLERSISDRTAAIIPVHIGGAGADMDRILAIANRRGVPVIEDACQAICGRWRDRGLGSWGATGCFSFQLSKNLCSGEGGAILTDDEELADRCFAFHSCCRQRPGASSDFRYTGGRNTNARMTELQGALLLSQLATVEQRAQTRRENAEYLSGLLREIPGIMPARQVPGCTQNGYHLYMFRVDASEFSGLSRDDFVRALRAEGIPCSTGYSPLNQAQFIQDALQSTAYQRVYDRQTLAAWAERNTCPQNDLLCQEAVWFMQNMLLGPRSDMDQIAAAVHKIHRHAAALAEAA